MSIITWNCQGALNKKLPSIVKSFISNYKVDIFVIMEPRISGRSADRVIRNLGFPHSHGIEASGFSGGIWVLWRPSVDVEILDNHLQFVHMKVRYLNPSSAFYFTAIYGSPKPCFRKLL